ncbi:hypothetical protein OAF98_05415 [Planctomicrobium sp.]|nr:hypothetical protein [Planctomicrobium sp.]MDB4743906.1 hypothetical protein [Planctomicrobium sp.]
MTDFKIDVDPEPTTRQAKSQEYYERQYKHSRKQGQSSGLLMFSYMFKGLAAFFLLLATASLFVFEIEEALLRFCILVGGAIGNIFFGLIAEALSKRN